MAHIFVACQGFGDLNFKQFITSLIFESYITSNTLSSTTKKQHLSHLEYGLLFSSFPVY